MPNLINPYRFAVLAAPITESFNKADGAMGPDLSWTTSDGTGGEVSSNQCRSISAFSEERCDTNLSSDDMVVSCDIIALSTVGEVAGVDARCNVSDRTMYGVRVYYGGTVWQIETYRRNAGTFISIDNTGLDIADTPVGQRLSLSVVGSTITSQLDGVTYYTGTDTNVTSGTYAGLNVQKGTNWSLIDSWAAQAR